MASSSIESLIVGAFVGSAAGYLGSLMITRQMALVGDALGHAALPGMGIALLLHVDPSLGAFVFLCLGILMIWELREETSLSLETLVGITFVSSLALGFLIVPQPELLESLIGDISKLTWVGTLITIFVSMIVMILVHLIIPPATARVISSDLKQYACFSVAFGVFNTLAGIIASKFIHFQAGPTIILLSCLLFMSAVLAKRFRLC